MKVTVSIKVAEREYVQALVDVTVGEEVVGGNFDTTRGPELLHEAITELVQDAAARALTQIKARKQIAEAEAVIAEVSA